MWEQYDEDLNKNPFFIELLTNHKDIIKRSSENGWIICVPREGSIETSDTNIEVFLDHIFIPNNEKPTHFSTLSKRQLLVNNKIITNHENKSLTTKILFEETFYIEDLKYTVWCLDNPLFLTRICTNHRPIILETFHDCIEFLWMENLGYVTEKIQEFSERFIIDNREFAIENLQTQKDLIGNLYSQCLQVALKSSRFLNRKIQSNILENIKLTIETCLQCSLRNFLIRAVNTVTTKNDERFNKIIRNSSDLQMKDLGINQKFCDIITRAKMELGKINSSSTILDKIYCLKLTFSHFESDNCITSDDLLQILVFLILKLNINNWISNLIFLTQFKFSSLNFSNQNCYLITTLEAAIEFIKSEQLTELRTNISKNIHPFADIIQSGDLNKLKSILDCNQSKITLCHPLCVCDKCVNLSANSNHLNFINEKGQNLLIIAIIFESKEVVEFLISLGFDVNFRDYYGKTPLHYACISGNQSLVLILVNAKANINIRDNDGNYPMHLAVINGRENCVKALLYTSNNLDIDAVNKSGETCLHYAVKFGYIDILKILIENGANVNIRNKRNQLPINLTLNYYIEDLLQGHSINSESDIYYIDSIQKDVSKSDSSTKSEDKCNDHGTIPRTLDELKKVDLLFRAIDNNDLPLTCFYLGFPDVTNTNYDHKSKCHPLCNCEKCGDCPIIIEKPDRINVNLCNSEGFTALHVAAKCGRKDILRLLLDSQALPNLKTYKNLYTPLHIACIYQRLQVVKELVTCGGCHLDAQDFRGNTPLYYACVRNDTRIVEVLLSSGADCKMQNYRGETIIKEVQDRRLYRIYKLLKDWNAEVESDNDLF